MNAFDRALMTQTHCAKSCVNMARACVGTFHAASMKIPNVLRQAFHKIADRRRRRRDQRRHEHLLRLEGEYSIPDFLRAPDSQLPPKPPAPPAEVGRESSTVVSRVVTPDLEIMIFSDGHQLKIPRLRKGR